MTNNCLESETQPIQEASESQARDGRPSLAERFEAALADCKDVAEYVHGLSWEELREREKAARLLAALGCLPKATRFRDCHVMGIPVDCVACGERYFSRYRCTLRYCEHCGPWHFSRLMEKYREPIAGLVLGQPSQRGRTLAMLTFTVRAQPRMPHPDEARRLMKLVRHWFKRMLLSGGVVWGAIFAVESGHELAVKHPGRLAGGWNLHVHALYYGPFLDQAAGLECWKELLGDSGGFRIKQCPGWWQGVERAVRRALIHHFGYILKPAAVSGERIAALEVLFSGIRRVHALGCFYRLPKPPRDVASARCPKCGESLPVNLRAWHRSQRFPIDVLEAESRRDWRALANESARNRIFRGGP